MINELDLTVYYKSHLLNFYRSMIYFRDQKIALNQSRILAKLQDPKKDKIYYRVIDGKQTNDSTELVEKIKNLLQQFEENNPTLRSLGRAGEIGDHSSPVEKDLIISA